MEIKESTLDTIADLQRQVNIQQQQFSPEKAEKLLANVNQLPSKLDGFLLETSTSKRDEIKQILEEIINELPENISSIDQEQQLRFLSSIENDLAELKTVIEENNLFWSGNKKWIEVICWTLFGTLLYLIQQTAEYKLKTGNHINPINKQESKDYFSFFILKGTDILSSWLLLGEVQQSWDSTQQKNKNFEEQDNKEYQEMRRRSRSDDYLERYKPQYYSYLLRSPFISLTILWVLSAANFNIAGVSLVLSDINETVLVSLAFILGYFNRVATTQLNLIVAAIFKDAWNRTVRNIDIDPCDKVIKYGGVYNFNVIPDVKVKWSILSQPQIGTIDIATGMYIAPPQPGYYCERNGEGQLEWKPLQAEEKNNKNHQQVIIRAVREDEESISTIALVILTDD